MADPDLDDVEPRHASERLADHIAREIDLGRLAPGAQLPSYRQLAADHGIAINTAQAAIRLVAATGRVVVRPSSGAYVAERDAVREVAVVMTPAEVAAIRDQVRRARSALADVDRALTGLLDRAAVPTGTDS